MIAWSNRDVLGWFILAAFVTIVMVLIFSLSGCSSTPAERLDKEFRKSEKKRAKSLGMDVDEMYAMEARQQAEKEWWREYKNADSDTREIMRYQREVYERERYMAVQERAARADAAANALRAWSAWRASSPYSNRPVYYVPSY